MSALRALFAQREAKAALAVWAVIPTLFLFFALTLAVDPSTQLGKLRLGVAVLDAGIETPQGNMNAGARLLEGMRQQFPVEIVQFQSEGELRDAVLGHDVAGGIIFPAGMTASLQGRQPVQLLVVKTDANDPVSAGFVNNLQNQLATNVNVALAAMLAGEAGAQSLAPLVTVAPNVVAATTDFRFNLIPATLLLPLWMASVAFAALLSRAAEHARRSTPGVGVVAMGLVELGVSAVGAAITAAVIVLDIALFTWRWEIDFIGLFAFLWLGLVAVAWLIQGTMRLFGIETGALLGVLALFVQQPVSGAAYPPAFAPDVVSWAEGIAPLRYLVEGMRNLLIGGNTTAEMAWALALLAGAGLVLFASGIAIRMMLPGQRRQTQPAPTG